MERPNPFTHQTCLESDVLSEGGIPLSSRSSRLKGETGISGLCSISKGLKVLRGDVVADMNETDNERKHSKQGSCRTRWFKKKKKKPDSWLPSGVDC